MERALPLLTRTARVVGRSLRNVAIGSSTSYASTVDAARDGHRATAVDRAQAHQRAQVTSSQTGFGS